MEELTPHLFFKKSNLLSFIASIFLFGIIILGTAESFSYSRVSSDLDAYTIAPGDSLNTIFKSMNLHYVEKILLKIYIKANKLTLIQAGHYDLDNKSWKEFIHSFSIGEIKKFEFKIQTGSNLYELRNLINNSSLKRDCPDFACLNKRFGYREGTLMPETYFYKFQSSAASVLKKSQDHFMDMSEGLWISKSKNNPLTSISDALILASIVEKEAGNDEEKKIIAGVFLHRLNLKMKLQADPTIIYGLLPTFNGNITKANIRDKNNPYNTYQIKRLPPTPISFISKSSLEAVILGEPNKYLYFVAQGDGSHYFSKDYNEHLEAVRRYQLEKQ